MRHSILTLLAVVGLAAACSDTESSTDRTPPAGGATSATEPSATSVNRSATTIAPTTLATPPTTEEVTTTTAAPVVNPAELGFALPDGFSYPEGIAVDPQTGRMYVTSTSGAIAVAEVGAATATLWSPAGANGRTFALGVEFGGGHVWVVSNPLLVEYDTDATPLAWYAVPPNTSSFLNDVAITDEAVYVTDSSQPIIWSVSLLPERRATMKEASLTEILPTFADPDFPDEGLLMEPIDLGVLAPSRGAQGFNGVEALPDGTLVAGDFACCSLHHVDPRAPSMTTIDLAGYQFTVSDGMSFADGDLWITQGLRDGARVDEVDRIRMCPSFDCGTVTAGAPDPGLSFPTDVQVAGDRVYVVNSQFDNGGGLGDGIPTLPFTISAIVVA